MRKPKKVECFSIVRHQDGVRVFSIYMRGGMTERRARRQFALRFPAVTLRITRDTCRMWSATKETS